MSPTVIIASIGVVGLAAIVALALWVGKGSIREARRTTWLCVAFCLALLASSVLLNLASVYYTKPIALLVALGLGVLVSVGLFVRIGTDVAWKWRRVLGLIGLWLATAVMVLALAFSDVFGGMVQPLFSIRAQQIAEANGFRALIVPGVELPTDMLPIDTLPAPEKGLSISYDGYWVQERKAAEGTTMADLLALVAVGQRPMGPDMLPIPANARLTEIAINEQPAVAVEYTITDAKAGSPQLGKSFDTVLLVFAKDGVDVRIFTESGVKMTDGEWVPFSALGVSDLVAIGESLRSAGKE